jgi:hypothetical protein
MSSWLAITVILRIETIALQILFKQNHLKNMTKLRITYKKHRELKCLWYCVQTFGVGTKRGKVSFGG